jgi:hypothetical protein
MRWLRRLFGIDCCGEWSPWAVKTAEFSSPPRNLEEKILAGWADSVSYTKDWMERRCLKCGYVQQKRLRY